MLVVTAVMVALLAAASATDVRTLSLALFLQTSQHAFSQVLVFCIYIHMYETKRIKYVIDQCKQGQLFYPLKLYITESRVYHSSLIDQ